MSHPFDAATARDWDARPISRQLAALADRLLPALPLARSDHVLDFGAGTGLLATRIAPRVARVTALDTSAAMLQTLAAKGHPNITCLCREVRTRADLPAPLDAIVSCMALHHVADIAALLHAFAAALRPGGHLALIDLCAEDGSFHGDAAANAAKGVRHHGFDLAALHSLATRAGLDAIGLEEVAHLHKPPSPHPSAPNAPACAPHAPRSYPLFLLTARKP